MNDQSQTGDEHNDVAEEDEPKRELKCHCPDTYPDWENVDIDLSRHCVHLISIPTFIHMPIAYEVYRRKQATDIENMELTEKWPGFSLTRTGMFGGKMFRLLEKVDSPSRYVTFLEGDFHVHARLHHGDVGTVKRTLGEMQMEMVDKGCRPKELYLGYITCPACEERKGGPKILVVRRWVESAGLKKRGANKTAA